MPNETKSAQTDASASTPKKKSSKLPLLLIILVLILALGGGAWVFLHGRAHASAAPSKSDDAPVAILHLDSFIVNLADTDQNDYLRISIDLGVGKPLSVEKKEADAPLPTARIRDAILSVLATRKAAELLTPEGKLQLKADLLASLQKKVPEIDVRAIYFTDFLVQR